MLVRTNIAPPVAPPPPTFDIVGLTVSEAQYIAAVLGEGNEWKTFGNNTPELYSRLDDALNDAGVPYHATHVERTVQEWFAR